MKIDDSFIQHEVLFNSVEAELVRRWATHDVPAHFCHRPVDHLQRVVKAWWHIYHESICAGQELDRNVWSRRTDYPAESLDTHSLVDGLEQIHQLINVGGLLSFRLLHSAEVAALRLLENMAAHYA